MNWITYITDLESWGFSLRGLARKLEVSPSALCDLKKGRSQQPKGDLAVRLLKLHAKHARLKRK